MKIRWINAEAREVPKVGFFQAGDEFECDDETAEALIRQNMAAKIKEKKEKEA